MQKRRNNEIKVLRCIAIYGTMSHKPTQGADFMYLKKSTNKKTGRTQLSIAHGYWDKERGHSRTKIIENLGFLDELQEDFEDPISHFKKIVEERNAEEKQIASEYVITARKDQSLTEEISRRMNYGYIVIMKLFYELGLEGFLNNRRLRESKLECNTVSIMKLLVISRILAPARFAVK